MYTNYIEEERKIDLANGFISIFVIYCETNKRKKYILASVKIPLKRFPIKIFLFCDNMGIVPSSPNGTNSDPWWSIENQNLNLDRSPLQINMDNQQGRRESFVADAAVHLPNENVSTSSNESYGEAISTNVSVKIQSDDENSVKTDDENSSTITNEKQLLPLCSSSAASAKKENACDANAIVRAHHTKEQSFADFKEDLQAKRECRKSALAELRTEIVQLKAKLAEQKEINQKLRRQQCKQIFIDLDNSIEKGSPSTSFSVDDDDDDDDVAFAKMIQQQENDREHYDEGAHSRDISLRSELAQCQLSLQLANGETLSLSSELNATQKQVLSLKEVIRMTKQMVAIRDEHLVEVFLINIMCV